MTMDLIYNSTRFYLCLTCSRRIPLSLQNQRMCEAEEALNLSREISAG